MKQSMLLFLLAAAVTVASTPIEADAQTQSTIASPPVSQPWTTSELLTAKPLKRSRPSPSSSAFGRAQPLPQLATGVVPGARADSRFAATQSLGARAYGSFGIPYTSTRVELGAGTSTVASSHPAFLSSTYPYRTIGRLNLKIGTVSTFCSASLIRRGILVTAAHCIQAFGSGQALFSNFEFIPAFWSNGSSVVTPYGRWYPAKGNSIARPAGWAAGTDPGDGVAQMNDLALIALAPRNRRFVGQLTGTMGYGYNNSFFISSPKTGNLAVAELNTLGYPGLLDNGRIMQMTSGPSYLTTVQSALQIQQGSTFTGGSSGGPWIANFITRYPNYSGGAGAGKAASGPTVVGVTSWGASDPNPPKDNFSSRFGVNAVYPNNDYGNRGAGNIGFLLNQLCSAKPTGSAQTFAQLDYCSP